MNKIQNYYLLTFENTTRLLKAEKEIRGIINYLIIPTPRVLTKSCSESLKIKEEDISKIKFDCIVHHFVNNKLEE